MRGVSVALYIEYRMHGNTEKNNRQKPTLNLIYASKTFLAMNMECFDSQKLFVER